VFAYLHFLVMALHV